MQLQPPGMSCKYDQWKHSIMEILIKDATVSFNCLVIQMKMRI